MTVSDKSAAAQERAAAAITKAAERSAGKKHEPFSDDDVKNFGPAILLERITVMGEAFLNPNGSAAAATYLSTTREQDCLHVVYFPRIQAVRLRLDVDKYASKYGKHIKHRDVWVPFARCKWGNASDEVTGV